MTTKFTIKGIRKFNDVEVLNKTLGQMQFNSKRVNILKRCKSPADYEEESYCLFLENCSTQGFNVKRMIGGSFIVELPWYACEADVRFCYAFLNAVKMVYRVARFTDEQGRDVTLLDVEADEQWMDRKKNMSKIINSGEVQAITGVMRDFYIDPDRYKIMTSVSDVVDLAYRDFVDLQWTDLYAKNLVQERRHISDDEELSSVRVVDNKEVVFIGQCRYVGMMVENDCKMIEYDKFCLLLSGHEEFKMMDASQALLHTINWDSWIELYREADGILIDNFRKTFIMRWNTDISNYKLSEFEGALDDFDCYEEGTFYYDWSIWDYQKTHIGDRVYMIRTGKGESGIVMRGTIIGEPYADEDWSGKGRKVYYVRMALTHMIHPDKSAAMLRTDELTKLLPGFNWSMGHSGEMLEDSCAHLLEEIWHSHTGQVHTMASCGLFSDDFNDYYKEIGWKLEEDY